MIILEQKNINFCSPLIKAIKDSVQRRFGSIWKNKELILASCLIPRFKLLLHDGGDQFVDEAWMKSKFECIKMLVQIPVKMRMQWKIMTFLFTSWKKNSKHLKYGRNKFIFKISIQRLVNAGSKSDSFKKHF